MIETPQFAVQLIQVSIFLSHSERKILEGKEMAIIAMQIDAGINPVPTSAESIVDILTVFVNYRRNILDFECLKCFKGTQA